MAEPWPPDSALDAGPTLAGFVEGWELYGDAAVAGGIAGAVLGLMGVYVVLRRMVFLSAAISQAASLGVVGALVAHLVLGLHTALVSPTVGAILATIAAALWLGSRHNRGGGDAALGVVYLGGAAGALVLGRLAVTEMHDVDALLFGYAVAITPEDLRLLLFGMLPLLAIHLWWWRGFALVTFDRDGAVVAGLPVRALEILLLVGLALATALSTRVLGALPTFAFAVLPGLAAASVARNVPVALAFALTVGAAQGFGGYVLSYLRDWPVGASQTLLGLGLWGIAAVIARLRGR